MAFDNLNFVPAYMPPDDINLVVSPDDGGVYFDAFWANDLRQTQHGTAATSQLFSTPEEAGHALHDGEVKWEV